MNSIWISPLRKVFLWMVIHLIYNLNYLSTVGDPYLSPDKQNFLLKFDIKNFHLKNIFPLNINNVWWQLCPGMEAACWITKRLCLFRQTLMTHGFWNFV